VDPIVGEAVALRGGVGVVEVGRRGGKGELQMGAARAVPDLGKVVDAPHQNRLAITGMEDRPRRNRFTLDLAVAEPGQSLEAPRPGLVAVILMESPPELLLDQDVEFSRAELPKLLVGLRHWKVADVHIPKPKFLRLGSEGLLKFLPPDLVILQVHIVLPTHV